MIRTKDPVPDMRPNVRIVPALNGKKNAVSFESIKLLNDYINVRSHERTHLSFANKVNKNDCASWIVH